MPDTSPGEPPVPVPALVPAAAPAPVPAPTRSAVPSVPAPAPREPPVPLGPAPVPPPRRAVEHVPPEEARGCLFALSQPPLMIFLTVIGTLLMLAAVHDLFLL
ncbi:hypothetical protein [Streptomyces sp. G-G2]|uniref:hypothetical protein n=1 Tax=Streptomyces sp. G-G2 TaxID=3046201 RepID=UPI0024B9DEC9|nr:hypothetical protein [Streptomyces sp. G-G2]MDJ0381075.1 hypothetical protein [Streptomyces sp. G-G2]